MANHTVKEITAEERKFGELLIDAFAVLGETWLGESPLFVGDYMNAPGTQHAEGYIQGLLAAAKVICDDTAYESLGEMCTELRKNLPK